jgi:formate dehydrogenase major subunit
MEELNFTLNGRPCTAPAGSTVLEAAVRNGVEIPALCNDARLKPFGSCMLCRVEIDGARGNPLACGQRLAEGMVVRTESDAIRLSRKTCLELLLSEHTGDCVAPCTMTCPAHVDARHYIEKIAEGDYSGAVRLVREQNPLPAVCGRIALAMRGRVPQESGG